MGNKSNKASELFRSGLNCSQAVLGAFCDNYNLDINTAIKISCGLGSGMRSAEICGAVSGAVLVVGLKYGHDKEICNTKTEEFITQFKKDNQYIICKEILNCDITTPLGREKAIENNLFETVCLDMVIRSAEILESLEY